MAVDLAKVKSVIAKNKADKERREKGSAPYIKFKDGEVKYLYFAPPCGEGMMGLPFCMRLAHKRDVPKGVKAKFKLMCQRDNMDENQDKCPACAVAKEHRSLKKAKGDEHDEIAGKYAARQDPVAQVIDVTSMYDEKGNLIKKMRNCFFKYGTKEDCPTCHLKASCEAGLQLYFMAVDIKNELLDHLDEEGDITDPKNALGVRVKRDGSGQFSTSYRSKIAKERFEFSDGAIERMNEKLVDLSKLDAKPTGTSAELKKMYLDFIEGKDMTGENASDDEADTGLPKCFGKYTKEKEEKRGCDDCAVRKECVKDDDDDNDKGDDDEIERRPKNLDKLRASLKEESKKGRHNRE